MSKGYYINNRVKHFTQASKKDIMDYLNTSELGLKQTFIEKNRTKYGENTLFSSAQDTILYRLKKSFVNPFSIVLLILAIISFITDILLTDNLKSNFTTLIILSMLLISGCVRFVQEMRTRNVTSRLCKLINLDVNVLRDGTWQQVAAEQLVVGDIIKLYPGERVPADVGLLEASECFVSQSAITGESNMLEKSAAVLENAPDDLNSYSNVIFTGSNIIGGSATGVVLAVGGDTAYGKMPLNVSASKNGFDEGATSIAWVLIKFMIILVPVVFIACGLTKGNWLTAFIFALSVAVGLTPELLPMVINACLAKGSINMGQKDTIVKNINAMQGFGSIDILCTDKTGTLTKDKLILEYYMDILGNESEKVLDYAFINSHYNTGIENPLDRAIEKVREMPIKGDHFEDLTRKFKKIDEIPFDHSRKISSILVEQDDGEKTLIMKGDVFSVLNHCSHVKYGEKIYKFDDNPLESVHTIVDEMLEDGMKVLAVATRKIQGEGVTADDEQGLILEGYIAFFDSPKESAASAILKLANLNVSCKVLTGDNVHVAKSICKRLGMNITKVMTGQEFEQLSDNEIQVAVEETDIFAELTPKHKSEIVDILQSNGHSVGFLGDGMNDLPAMLQAEVGISVDTAAEAVKEAADVILLKKDLGVLEEGILEGRKAFVNMSKYIKITASSNFGNILSIVVASIVLPFFPMTSIQLLLLNLLYDILCLILPWDNVDDEFYSKPLEWSGRNLSRFMLYFGPVSSVFDIITFGFLMFYLCPSICGGNFVDLGLVQKESFASLFQTGWFLESMWSQILILQLLRTKKIPFIQSRTSRPVILVMIMGILVFTTFAMTGMGSIMGMTPLPFIYFVFLFIVVTLYLLTVTLTKKLYVKKFGNLI